MILSLLPLVRHTESYVAWFSVQNLSECSMCALPTDFRKEVCLKLHPCHLIWLHVLNYCLLCLKRATIRCLLKSNWVNHWKKPAINSRECEKLIIPIVKAKMSKNLWAKINNGIHKHKHFSFNESCVFLRVFFWVVTYLVLLNCKIVILRRKCVNFCALKLGQLFRFFLFSCWTLI